MKGLVFLPTLLLGLHLDVCSGTKACFAPITDSNSQSNKLKRKCQPTVAYKFLFSASSSSFKCLAPTYMGDFSLDGATLRKKGINRIGNMLVPNKVRELRAVI